MGGRGQKRGNICEDDILSQATVDIMMCILQVRKQALGAVVTKVEAQDLGLPKASPLKVCWFYTVPQVYSHRFESQHPKGDQGLL